MLVVGIEEEGLGIDGRGGDQAVRRAEPLRRLDKAARAVRAVADIAADGRDRLAARSKLIKQRAVAADCGDIVARSGKTPSQRRADASGRPGDGDVPRAAHAAPASRPGMMRAMMRRTIFSGRSLWPSAGASMNRHERKAVA